MVFGFIVLHAPITVWVGSHIPELALGVKAWKEAMIILAAVLVSIALFKQHKVKVFFRQPIVVLVCVYVVVHLFLLGIYPQSVQSSIAGLLIDLRYSVFFVTVYGFLQLYPEYKEAFIRVGIVGAFIVCCTTAVQLLLPKDALSTLGYGPNTIEPYLTVDKNPDFIRYNSTLRGPNPLGAFAVMVLAGAVAYANCMWRGLASQKKALVVLLGGAAMLSLWVSYSRSALLAAVVALVVLYALITKQQLSKKTWIVLGVIGLVVAAAVYMAKDTTFVANVLLHDNPTTGAMVDSNAAHAESLANGISRMAVQPLGAGVGSTGSASLLAGGATIIENQYLMIAHEAGWGGLTIFLLLFVMVLLQVKQRDTWLARAVFASGIGLAVVGLFLPVWADDTISIVWWGLAAVALTGGIYGQNTANKKAKRAA